jgi:hypothetical protein
MTKTEIKQKLDLVKSVGNIFRSVDGCTAMDINYVMVMHMENPNTAKMMELVLGNDPISFKFPRLGIEDFMGTYSMEYFLQAVEILKKAGCEEVVLHAGYGRTDKLSGPCPLLMGGRGSDEIGDLIITLSPRIRTEDSGVITRYKEYLDVIRPKEEPKPEPVPDDGFDIKPRTVEEHKDKIITTEGP